MNRPLGQKTTATIITCDPTQRLVQGRLPDKGTVSIGVYDIGSAFRWPQVGEVWSIVRGAHGWVLGARYNQDAQETYPVTSLPSDPGLRLDGTTIFDTNGNQLAAVNMAGIADGDYITYSGANFWPLPPVTSFNSIEIGGVTFTAGSGAPYMPNGVEPNRGGFYFRSDTPGVHKQNIYACISGGYTPMWSGIV